MPLSIAKRRYVRRLTGYATNPVRKRVRHTFRQEQHHLIGGAEVVLPPSHDLPFYQRRDPTYDTYSRDLLSVLASGSESLLLVDVGANVGDTAVSALTSADNISVIAVEGNPSFASYLRRNVEPFSTRCKVVEGFVGPVGDRVAYATDGSTGGFPQGTTTTGTEIDSWISPAELLDGASSHDRIVWKSDTDGFDIHIAAEHWDTISSRCDSIWLEWDPAGTMGDRADIPTLIDLLSRTGHSTRVFDNLGREMVQLLPGQETKVGMETLTRWLMTQRGGHLAVPYLDIWNCPW